MIERLRARLARAIYHPYAQPAAVGYCGSLHLFGRCVGFVGLDGRLVARW